MYQNKVTLHRLSRRQPRSSHRQQRQLTTLSLQPSPHKKDDNTSRTPNGTVALVFGKLSEFAKTFTRAHISKWKANCQPRVREQKTDTKQRVWEIRVASILKLTGRKAAPEIRITMKCPKRKRPA